MPPAAYAVAMAGFASGPAMALVELGLVLAVFVGVAAWLKRRSGATGNVLSIRLTPQHAVHQVRVGTRLFLIGTGPSGAPRMLTELEGDATSAVSAERFVVVPGGDSGGR